MEEILFEKLNLGEEEKYLIRPFFTNLDKSVYAITLLPPEIGGALCSRASRAREDLRIIFLKEFIKPFIEEETNYKEALRNLIDFLNKHPTEVIFSNPKAREFYIKWLAEYGDDSIAQMAGTYLICSSLSQVAIKYLENQRIGISFIEKSTRYVDFSSKIDGNYRYHIPDEIKEIGLEDEYKSAMDNLFETYTFLYQKYFEHLKNLYPEEKEIVLKTKVFDVIRGILPASTLGQVSVYGNGQSFEYLINRCLNHSLSEIRWIGKRAYEELNKIIPAFLKRLEKEESKEYRKYLGERGKRVKEIIDSFGLNSSKGNLQNSLSVKLLEYDPDGENKIIAHLIYPELKERYEKILEKVRRMETEDKEKILENVLKDRKFRWYKVPRAFESVYLRFEILTNLGSWRDLQRHRMQSQYHQKWNIFNGFDVPKDIIEIGLGDKFISAIRKAEEVFDKIYKVNEDLAQYSVCLAHKIRFIQYQNLREFFWETELRTISQGHPDYRKIEQEKAKIVQKIYPLIGKYLLVDFKDYEFARRESVEKINEKLKRVL